MHWRVGPQEATRLAVPSALSDAAYDANTAECLSLVCASVARVTQSACVLTVQLGSSTTAAVANAVTGDVLAD
jgi:hypothetical protein